MRLINGDELYGIESLLNTEIVQNSPEAAWLISQVLHDIQASPTIDPETLPVVQELRKQVHDLQERMKLLRYWDMERTVVLESARKDRAAVNVMRKRCEKTIANLRAELARVTAERDAAVNYRLPVKPGDKVYQQNGADVYELAVKKIIFDCGHIAFDESAIGSSIYLSKEAAKAALARLVKP